MHTYIHMIHTHTHTYMHTCHPVSSRPAIYAPYQTTSMQILTANLHTYIQTCISSLPRHLHLSDDVYADSNCIHTYTHMIHAYIYTHDTYTHTYIHICIPAIKFRARPTTYTYQTTSVGVVCIC